MWFLIFFSSLRLSQKRMAMIAEMIHTSSLLHDDVIDDAITRRNKPSVNQCFTQKEAILAGDFILSKAAILLAQLKNTQAVANFSQIINDLVKGDKVFWNDYENKYGIYDMVSICIWCTYSFNCNIHFLIFFYSLTIAWWWRTSTWITIQFFEKRLEKIKQNKIKYKIREIRKDMSKTKIQKENIRKQIRNK